MRKTYPTDLSDSEWARIEPYLPVPKAPGRPRVHPLSPSARDPKRYLLHRPQRMCLASVAARLPTLEDRPSLLQDLAHRRYLGAAKHSAMPAFTGTTGEKPAPQRWDGRLTVG